MVEATLARAKSEWTYSEVEWILWSDGLSFAAYS